MRPGVRGIGRLRALRLFDRVVQEVVIEQQLAQAQVPLRRGGGPPQHGGPGPAGVVALARLELRFAEPDDGDLAGRVDANQSRPGGERPFVVAQARGGLGQGLQRGRLAREPRQRAIEAGVRRRAISVAPLSLAQADGKSDLGWESARQISSREDRLLVPAETIEEPQQALAERGVARRQRRGLLRGGERAVQIAELFADLAQQIPLDGTGRRGEGLGERPQGAPRPRHLPRAGPGRAATLRRVARELPQQRAHPLRGTRRIRWVAIGETKARRPKNERSLRAQLSWGDSPLEDGRCLCRSPGARQRIGQLFGGAIALRFQARQLAPKADDPLGPVARPVGGGRRRRLPRWQAEPAPLRSAGGAPGAEPPVRSPLRRRRPPPRIRPAPAPAPVRPAPPARPARGATLRRRPPPPPDRLAAREAAARRRPLAHSWPTSRRGLETARAVRRHAGVPRAGPAAAPAHRRPADRAAPARLCRRAPASRRGGPASQRAPLRRRAPPRRGRPRMPADVSPPQR